MRFVCSSKEIHIFACLLENVVAAVPATFSLLAFMATFFFLKEVLNIQLSGVANKAHIPLDCSERLLYFQPLQIPQGISCLQHHLDIFHRFML